MISLDTNILLPAVETRNREHGRAAGFVESLQHREDVAISELILLELYGLLRNPAVLAKPLTASAAVRCELEAELKRARRRRVRVIAGALCVVLMAGVIGQSVFWRGEQAWPAVETAAQSSAVVSRPEKRVLPDGSVVELKEGASIAVDFNAATRRVALQRGEAYFQVAGNPVRPFVVSAGSIEARAVGTAFTVQLGSSAVEVLVTEGRVAVVTPIPDSCWEIRLWAACN